MKKAFTSLLVAALFLVLIPFFSAGSTAWASEVWTWGGNWSGQLGDGTYESRETPAQVIGLSDVIAISTPMDGSLVLKSDGTVWMWGIDNAWVPEATSYTSPTQVIGLDSITAISGGWFHSLALKEDRTVWAWGTYTRAVAGMSPYTYSLTPVQVPGLDNIVAIAGGASHSLALRADGAVLSWGYNDLGQLGNETNTDSFIPVQVNVVNVHNIIAIAAGSYHSLALREDGTVWAWGSNTEMGGSTVTGQLGDGSTNPYSNIPVQVVGLDNVKAIFGGGWHSIALKNDGAVWTWGLNSAGQLGNGSYENSNIPVQAIGLSDVKAISGKCNRTVALKTDGTVWTWGWAYPSQSTIPVLVEGLSGVSAIAAGMDHTMVLTSAELPPPGDFTPPSTVITLSGISGNNGWYTADVQVTLSATDRESGVAQIEYSYDGISWITYFEPFLVSSEGTTAIYYRSIDNAGNQEQRHIKNINIDKTAPMSSILLSGSSGENGWYISDVVITLTAADNTSGIDHIMYSTDGSNWVAYTVPFTVSTEGNISFYYYAVDNAGIVESSNMQTLKIDKTPPKTTGDVIGINELASISFSGTQANGDSSSTSISGNGRYVVFSSSARNIVTGDTNEASDIFVFDRLNRTTKRASVSSAGEQGNGESSKPVISEDGRYVTFLSTASNLVADDPNAGGRDIFIHDLQNGTTERVNIPTTDIDEFSITPDGRYVAFSSVASNLVPNDTNGQYDIFVMDRQTNIIERVNVSSSGEQADLHSMEPSISNDGRYVVFTSRAKNLVPNDYYTEWGWDVFIRDRQTGTTELVSEGYDTSWNPRISGDGRYVVFQSNSFLDYDVNGPFVNTWFVYLHDLQKQSTELISISDSGGWPNNWSGFTEWKNFISADGRYVVFNSMASDLVPGDTMGKLNAFVRDRLLGITKLVSISNSGEFGNGDSATPSISSDGRYVAFHSGANNLIQNDANGFYDVFVRDFALPHLNGTLGNNGWYISDGSVTLSTADNASGVSKTEFSVNGSSWSRYANPIEITTEGITSLYYFSTDYAGNKEVAENISVKIDKTPPVTSLSLTGDVDSNGQYTSEVLVNFSATDNGGSGIARIEYSLNGANWTIFTVPFKIKQNGTFTINYRSMDNAGLLELEKMHAFTIYGLPIYRTIEDFESGDLSSFPWDTGGDGAWATTGLDSHSGNLSAEAPADILVGQKSYLQVTMDCVDGKISFWYKIVLYPNYHLLDFYIDDVKKGTWIYGTTPWTYAEFPVSAGSHTFKWVYSRSPWTTNGYYTARLDDIVFPRAIPSYSVSATSGANGSISPSGMMKVSYGGTQTFTITPDTGYYIDSVSGCRGTLSGNTYTTGQITADCTVAATFAAFMVPPGTNVPVTPLPGINITFDNVTSGGDMTVTERPDLSPPANFSFLGKVYDISTTATFAGAITVCLNYNDAGLTPSDENNLLLLHYENNSWNDITSSRDAINNVVCGVTNSLSPFAIAFPIDTTPPVITASASPSPNANGWNNTDVTVTFTCTDSESGIATCPSPVTVSTEGENQVISGTATDNAGHSSSTSLTLNIDKTPPAITLTGITDGATYTLGAVPIAGYTVTDYLSGVDCQSANLTGGNANGVGTYTYTVSACDTANNTKTVVATYNVAYNFSGFLTPVSLGKPFKLGSTIPVKFQLTDSNGNYISTANATIMLQQYSNDEPFGDPIDGTPTNADWGNMFRYSAIDNQYIYNLNTKGLSQGIWQIRATLDDGTVKTVFISLK